MAGLPYAPADKMTRSIAKCVDDADSASAFQQHAINFDAALYRKILAGANAIIEEGDSSVDATA